mmetsp:Transcript_25590/g.50082  ORF Transcript_25590/g.50082 Transcript_25590/m.50082 type:complete len:1016 (+) Transcript_25590:3-3050(+)
MMLLVLLPWVTEAAALPRDAASNGVEFTNRSVIIDGKPTLLFSGAVHYPRVPRSDWGRVFAMAKDMGINTIQTYSFWNVHEPKEGQLEWTGQADLREFIHTASAHNLFVTLRIGPFVCAEYLYGGLPLWMRHKNASCYRCSDPVWEREMSKWTATVVEQVEDLLYPHGPVIMLQIENEYNGPDAAYLDWSVSMARNLTTKVPWILCHDVTLCSKLNAGRDRALCTINGFWEDQWSSLVSQPSPTWLQYQWQHNPNQPGVWTEDQGWFDQWGVAQRYRRTEDQAYGIMRFFAYGGSWHNFYMLTGGNHYGRTAGGEVTTAYAPDTVIDFLLLKHQPRYDVFQRLFTTLASVSDELLAHPIAQPESLHPTPTTTTTTTTTTTATTERFQETASSSSSFPQQLQITTCYQYADPHQTFLLGKPDAEGFSTLRTQATGSLCVGGESLFPVKFVACAQAPGWRFNSTNQHIEGNFEIDCQKKGKTGKCRPCIDIMQSTKIDLYDCKGPEDHQQDHQTWSYDPDAGTIKDSTGSSCLTSGDAPAPPHGTGAEAHRYGDVAFLSNYQETESMLTSYESYSYYLPPTTVVLVKANSGMVLFNTSHVHDDHDDDDDEKNDKNDKNPKSFGHDDDDKDKDKDNDEDKHKDNHKDKDKDSNLNLDLTLDIQSEGDDAEDVYVVGSVGSDGGSWRDSGDSAEMGPLLSWPLASRASEWSAFREPKGFGAQAKVSSEGFIDQLDLTDNDSDYAWYLVNVTSDQFAQKTPSTIEVWAYDGTRTYFYINGVLAGFGVDGYTFEYEQRDIITDVVEIKILSCAMGVSNNQVAPTMAKGVMNVTINNVTLSKQPWTHKWVLEGEDKKIFLVDGDDDDDDDDRVDDVPWVPSSEITPNETAVWFRSYIDLPSDGLHQWGTGGPQPANIAFALYLGTMNKGTAYVNGFNIGRFNAQPGEGDCSSAGCAPPRHGTHCYMRYKGCDEPTQTLYHIPYYLLKPKANLVVLFEESNAFMERNVTSVRIMALKSHPDRN